MTVGIERRQANGEETKGGEIGRRMEPGNRSKVGSGRNREGV